MICVFLFTQFPNTSLIEVSSYIRTSLGLEFLFPAVNLYQYIFSAKHMVGQWACGCVSQTDKLTQ